MKTVLSICALLLSLVFMNSCSSSKADPQLYQRQWMLKKFKNYEYDFLVRNRAQLDLAPTKSLKDQYRGYMGCNQMFLTAVFLKNGTVKFSDVGGTMMYCENNMKLEEEFARELPAMTKYSIDGHQLTLSDGKGKEMQFVAADWD